MPQLDKTSTSKLNGRSEFELKLVGDTLLPERSRSNKERREEKKFKSIG